VASHRPATHSRRTSNSCVLSCLDRQLRISQAELARRIGGQQVTPCFHDDDGSCRSQIRRVSSLQPRHYLSGSKLEALANRRPLALGLSQIANFSTSQSVYCMFPSSQWNLSEQPVENAGSPQSPTTMSTIAG